MAKRTKKKRESRWPTVLLPAARVATKLSLPLVLIAFAGWGLNELEGHVLQSIGESREGRIEFIDVPEDVYRRAMTDLQTDMAAFDLRTWTDRDLCRDIATSLSQSAWVAGVKHVRRDATGRFEIACHYRTPFAGIGAGDRFYFVSRDGVRLPGSYSQIGSVPLIRGVEADAPAAGERWTGEDVQAGVRLLELVAREPYAHQIRGVIVDNYRGRLDARFSHLLLATDRHGGRIRWGSAPGQEMEENSVEEKLAILRANYRRTGRLDANNLVIEISTFPDRFLTSD